LLSQLVTGNARAPAGGKMREGQPPVGEGASDGGKNKQPAVAKRHKGCLQKSGSPLGVGPFLPSPRTVERRQGVHEL
jgi:hypothetical protein